MKIGSSGLAVRGLQARLKQIGWYSAAVTGNYGRITTSAVRGFQAKRGIPVTGAVDRRTLDRLRAMTRTPTNAELYNKVPTGSAPSRPALPHRPGDLRQQTDQLAGLGGQRAGPAADGRALRIGPYADPRGLVPGRLEVAPPLLLAV